MFDPLLIVSDGTDPISFSLISQSGTETKRIDIASDPAQPRNMVVRHSVAGKSPNQVDRHNVVFSKTTVDDDTDRTAVASASLVITQPRNGLIATTETRKLLEFVRHLLESNENFAEFMRGGS